ncbi:hypothetical protein RKD30_000296 [Streptomyces pristinaespiralis]
MFQPRDTTQATAGARGRRPPAGTAARCRAGTSARPDQKAQQAVQGRKSPGRYGGARARQRWCGQGGPGTQQAPNTRASAPRTDPPAGTRAHGEQAVHDLPKGAGRPCTRPGVGAARPRTGGAGHGPRSGPARPRRSATTKPGARRRRHRTAGAARKTGPGPGTAATSTAELPHPSGRRTQPGPQAGRPTPRQRRTGKCPQPRPRPGHGRRSEGTKTRPPPQAMGRGPGRNRTKTRPPPGPAGGRVHDRCCGRGPGPVGGGRWPVGGAGRNDRGRPGVRTAARRQEKGRVGWVSGRRAGGPRRGGGRPLRRRGHRGRERSPGVPAPRAPRSPSSGTGTDRQPVRSCPAGRS